MKLAAAVARLEVYMGSVTCLPAVSTAFQMFLASREKEQRPGSDWEEDESSSASSSVVAVIAKLLRQMPSDSFWQ